jgi:uncharacterized protein YeaO (DUF488 family)
MIKLKRAYDRAIRDDGVRYLVERLWRPARRGPVTLIFSSYDTEHNAGVALRDYLKMYAAR